MENLAQRKFPASSKDYKLYEEVGEGGSATVYRALCIPLNEIVAVKVFDLEKCQSDMVCVMRCIACRAPIRSILVHWMLMVFVLYLFLGSFVQDAIRQEVQTMSLIEHPNLLRQYCSFATGSSLWVVMPYMACGSCRYIMQSAYPDGFEQPVIATLLYEVIKALAYLHAQGLIHRDIKAGNILVDSKGAVKLADFGLVASMFDTGSRRRSRKTFAGTPCWMAPEVMQQLHGYDFKADIWSFGITALELAHGHAPFSKYPPMKVFLMTVQNAPPGLDYHRDKRFSKSFKEIVAACLVKDPVKRPTAEKLLKHRFFKYARSNEILARTILDGLSPLGERFRMLREKEADLVHNKAMYESQREYIRGISAWNFDLEDLKRQAGLIQDDDGFDDLAVLAEKPSGERLNHSNVAESTSSQEDGRHYLRRVGSSPAISPVQSREALGDQLLHLQNRDKRKLSSEDAFHEMGFQNKGWFTIKFADSRPKDAPNSLINPFSRQSINSMPSTGTYVLLRVQSMLQQNAIQKEQIVRLIRYVNETTGNNIEYPGEAGNDDSLQTSLASARESVLQDEVISMEQSIKELFEELQRWKIKNTELEKQLTALGDK
ncbi:serine/threonine-protein kinase BLUS1-like isoform X2 [Alnus glutinosa]|uniref:serine/threonine-protein kinase BLUS1-like isoform X2 n=1 Tax=Alnus glutinosa TaxID=3517 RepID=UPI002D77D9BE|nr:serine/threonine-protein kinase BLUS1-like isoform X2 [Alnus glutinosa]